MNSEIPPRPVYAWQGEFGDRYVDRNDYADWKIANGVVAFDRMLGRLPITSILEVGCNIGLNLLALNRLFGGTLALYAVEPNANALQRLTARDDVRLAGSWTASGDRLPLADGQVDLAFTSGVLIHVPPSELEQSTRELVRVSSRYVLCIEYFSHEPVEIAYHGQPGMLWKRDFGGYYLAHHPELKTVRYGFLWQQELKNFDNLNWWLFEKATT